MFRLIAKDIQKIFEQCIVSSSPISREIGRCWVVTSPSLPYLMVDVVTQRYVFDKEKIIKNRIPICYFLSGLPIGFRWDCPPYNGQPLRQAKFDFAGEEWANNPQDIENLIAMGITAGVMIPLIKERKLWDSFMFKDPYFVITSYYRPQDFVHPVTYNRERT